MPGVRPASPNAVARPRYNSWLSPLRPSQRGVAPDQQAVEREPELSLPRTPPKFLCLRRVKGRRMQARRCSAGVVGRFCETPSRYHALRLASDTDALQCPSWLLRRRQPQNSDDALEIVRSVVLDLNSPPLVSMVNRHMGGQMLLQLILQILHCRRRSARIGGLAPRFASPPTDTEQAGNHSLGSTYCGVAAQNCFPREQLFFRRF